MSADALVVRVGALPIRLWLAGANEELFRAAEALEVLRERSLIAAREVAAAIGQRLIPNASLAKSERAHLLAVRRQLHRGLAVDRLDEAQAVAIARRAGAPDLAENIHRCYVRAATALDLEAEIGRRLDDEQQRLFELPGRTALDSSLAATILERLLADDCAGVAATQRGRAFERCWQHVGRAATIAVPRAWMSHVGLITEGQRSNTSVRASVQVGVEGCVQWTEGVRSARSAAWEAREEVPLVANPLHWCDDGERFTVVFDRHAEPSCVVMRDTEALQSVLGLLSERPRSLDELAARGTPDRAELRELVQHLLETGVVQATATVRSTTTMIDLPRAGVPRIERSPSPKGWIDVHRTIDTGLDSDVVRGLRDRLGIVLELLQIIERHRGRRAPEVAGVRSRNFAEILRASLMHVVEAAGRPESGIDDAVGHELPLRLREHLRRHAGDHVVDIPVEVVKESCIRDDPLEWPVDCLIRVPGKGTGYSMIVSEIWPAGVLDSRFHDGMQRLTGVPQINSYREFLRRIEAQTGVTFVEVLAPPLSDRAENAVRRPGYTSAWTGDPVRDLYVVGPTLPEQYVRLQDIELVPGSNGYQSYFDGRRIWPVYHATRSLSHVWDDIVRTLLATAPVKLPATFRRPEQALRPGNREYAPRITLAGDIVLAPARWLVAAAEIWSGNSGAVKRVGDLVRLRRRLRLPRWLYASDPQVGAVAPCDLESIATVQVLSRIAARHGAVLLTEMLPLPDDLLIHDALHFESDRLCSELVVRLPAPADLADLADRISRRLCSE